MIARLSREIRLEATHASMKRWQMFGVENRPLLVLVLGRRKTDSLSLFAVHIAIIRSLSSVHMEIGKEDDVPIRPDYSIRRPTEPPSVPPRRLPVRLSFSPSRSFRDPRTDRFFHARSLEIDNVDGHTKGVRGGKFSIPIGDAFSSRGHV